jgi:carbon storage regulator CsrA
MLVLQRDRNEKIMITVGSVTVEVVLVEARKDWAKIGFVAPAEVIVDRKEIYERKQQMNSVSKVSSNTGEVS